jgi:phosphoenolpyruvate carboxykinase (ATP)
MPINATRTMLRAALSGDIDDVEFRTDELFGLEVPVHVPGVEDSLLDPRSTWSDPERYDVKARELAQMFADNFAKRFPDADESIRAAGPNL